MSVTCTHTAEAEEGEPMCDNRRDGVEASLEMVVRPGVEIWNLHRTVGAAIETRREHDGSPTPYPSAEAALVDYQREDGPTGWDWW